MAGILNDTTRDLIAIAGLALALWQASSQIRNVFVRTSAVFKQHSHLTDARKRSVDASPARDYDGTFSSDDRRSYLRFIGAVSVANACISIIVPSLGEWAAGLLLMFGAIAAMAGFYVALALAVDYMEALERRLDDKVYRKIRKGIYAIAVVAVAIAAGLFFNLIDRPIRWWSSFVLVHLGVATVFGLAAVLGATLFGVGVAIEALVNLVRSRK